MKKSDTTKVDSRVQQTRKVIQEALISLTVEKGYNAISVQDIVECASINHSTFYRHYLDKDDLLSKYMDEVTGVNFQDDPLEDPTEEGPPSGLVKLLSHIGQFCAFYRIMLGANGHPLVSDRLRRKIEGRSRLVLAESTTRDLSNPSFEMRLRYVSGAGIGAILWWVENDTPCTAEELASWIVELSTAAIKS